MTGPQSSIVLVVDDDQDCAAELAELLECHGYDTQVAVSADQARKTHGATPAGAIVMDLVLGRESGVDLALDLLASSAQPPRIVIVSGRRPTDRERVALGEQGLHFLLKPVDLDALMQALGQVGPDIR